MPAVYKAVNKNKYERNKLKEVLKPYTPFIRCAISKKSSPLLSTYLMEHVIDECVKNFELKK